jgi:hypothetical protein
MLSLDLGDISNLMDREILRFTGLLELFGNRRHSRAIYGFTLFFAILERRRGFSSAAPIPGSD